MLYIDGPASRTAVFGPVLFKTRRAGKDAAITVLVVDDDPIVGDMYRLSLTRAGYNVIVGRDGRQGLELAESERPAIIFLDIRMPAMDGIQVLEALGSAAATRDIPVVMLSNYDDGYFVSESLRLGAKEYLVKAGIDPAELAAVVARWSSPHP